MKLKTEFILRISAGTALIIGAVWTAINLSQADNYANRMRSKLDTIAQLQEMKKGNDALEASFALLHSISNSAPSLASLASGTTPEIRELDSHSIGRGWNARRTEVTFREINLDALSDFLSAAETRRPPWRLTECVIASSQKTDGYGTAVLTLETISK